MTKRKSTPSNPNRVVADRSQAHHARGTSRRPTAVPLDWQPRAALKSVSRDGAIEYSIYETPEGDAHLVVDCGFLGSVHGARRVAAILARVLQRPDGICRDLENLDPEIVGELGDAAPDRIVLTARDLDNDQLIGEGFAQPG